MRYAWRTMKVRLKGIDSIVPPAVLAIAAAGLWYAASGYGATARQLPMLVASGIFVLALLDLLSRLPGAIGALLRTALGAGFDEPELDTRGRWPEELVQLGWVVAAVAAVVFAGFLVTIPVFVFLYSRLHGSRSTLASLAAAGIATGGVVLVFEVLLDYTLYRGVLFGADFHV